MSAARVELVGLPGAGKTTFSKELVSRLAGEGLRVLDRTEHRLRVASIHMKAPRARRLGDYLRHHMADPRAALAALKLAVATKPRGHSGVFRAYLLTRLHHNRALFEANAPAHDVLLLDQDLLQEVWGVLYLRRCPDPKLLEALITALRPHLPDVLIHVQAPGALALERIRDRAALHGSMTDLDRMPHLEAADMEATARELSAIVASVQRVKGSRLVHVDGTLPFEDQVTRAADAVFETLRDRGCQAA